MHTKIFQNMKTYTLERILAKLFLPSNQEKGKQEQHQTKDTAQTVTLDKYNTNSSNKARSSEIKTKTSLHTFQPSLRKKKNPCMQNRSKINTGLPHFPKTLALYCLTITVYTIGKG